MSGRKLYRVKLTQQERERFEEVVQRGRVAAWKRQRSQAMLLCDEGSAGPGWKDQQVVEVVGVSTRSIESWRKQAIERGPLSLLERKSGSGRPRKLDGDGEAQLIALACSEPPEGRSQWTLSLLGDRLVELKIVDSIAPETVRQTLKQTNSSLGDDESGASRPGRTRPS